MLSQRLEPFQRLALWLMLVPVVMLAGCDKKPYVSEHASPEDDLKKSIQSFNPDAQAGKFDTPEMQEFNLHKRHGLGAWSKRADQKKVSERFHAERRHAGE